MAAMSESILEKQAELYAAFELRARRISELAAARMHLHAALQLERAGGADRVAEKLAAADEAQRLMVEDSERYERLTETVRALTLELRDERFGDGTL
jgi:hypothetical protein